MPIPNPPQWPSALPPAAVVAVVVVVLRRCLQRAAAVLRGSFHRASKLWWICRRLLLGLRVRL
ncbi:hypothetical protein ACTHRK_17380 [Dietzia cercidiphylli]|uniref:hypothetical protein n=1 Tax=Dietzia cercidiphylli TaxID=498199 RepID=UPI003F7D8898